MSNDSVDLDRLEKIFITLNRKLDSQIGFIEFMLRDYNEELEKIHKDFSVNISRCDYADLRVLQTRIHCDERMLEFLIEIKEICDKY